MSHAQIENLKKAYQQSPDNNELLMILVLALHENDLNHEAYNLIKKLDGKKITSNEHAVIAAKVCLHQQDPERALNFSKNFDTPEANILKSKIYLALNQADESLKFYNSAIADNASLECISLLGQINAGISNKSPSNKNNSNVIKLMALSGHGENKLSSYKENTTPQEILFNDVGGLEDIKNQIYKKIILPFKKPSIFEKFKKKAGGGVLMYGPPGCGKTMLARATAGECKAKFYNIEIADVLDMYIGEAEKRLHDIFERARQTTPSILFFDEIEAIAGKRNQSSTHNGAQLVSQFLAEMDGFAQKNEGVLVLGATNTPWHIDAAFRRPGRFDRVIFIAPPDFEARSYILKVLLDERPTEENLNISYLAKKTSGFSGADLKDLVDTACDYAIEDSLNTSQEIPISDKHLEQALTLARPTVLEWLTTAKNYAKYANEGGHYNDVLLFLEKFGKR